jgi:hypothetical protein
MNNIDCCILRRYPHALARQPYVVSVAEVSVLGVDLDAIGADSLWIAAIALFVLLGLCNQVFRLLVGVPDDPVQKGKAIPEGNTDIGTKLDSSSGLVTNNRSNMSLNQIDDTIRHAAGLGVQQVALLTVQSLITSSLRHQWGFKAERLAPQSIRASITLRLRCRQSSWRRLLALIFRWRGFICLETLRKLARAFPRS